MKKCKRGHKKTPKNIGFTTTKGKKYPFCKICRSIRSRELYATNPELRARTIKRSLNQYYIKRAQNGLGQIS